MALVSLRQLLDHAAEFQYGLPAFNVNNMEQIHAILQAADERSIAPSFYKLQQVQEVMQVSHF
jgi:fructose/tagatose bisphosphate aldolase